MTEKSKYRHNYGKDWDIWMCFWLKGRHLIHSHISEWLSCAHHVLCHPINLTWRDIIRSKCRYNAVKNDEHPLLVKSSLWWSSGIWITKSQPESHIQGWRYFLFYFLSIFIYKLQDIHLEYGSQIRLYTFQFKSWVS